MQNDNIVYKYTYLGPTNTKGSRIKVENTKTGETKTAPYNYGAGGSEPQVKELIEKIEGNPVQLVYGGGTFPRLFLHH
jgi:hypothetical protein